HTVSPEPRPPACGPHGQNLRARRRTVSQAVHLAGGTQPVSGARRPVRPHIPSSLSFWFIPTDGSTHPGNPDCEESGESSSSGGSELEPSGHQLFCLEYESDNGEVTSVIVYQDDDPGRVSEEVSAHTPLDLPMREALKLRIQEEIAKRQSRH
uniref:Uncharacterized protein n=1 Tax=Marmota marmota marmota TaxID=9994 RepID=A0A8C6ERQ7_MARMA